MCAAVLALPFIWLTWGANWLAEREWQTYLEKARARGVVFSLQDLQPPPVPPEDDWSASPLFRSVPAGSSPFDHPVFHELYIGYEIHPVGPDWGKLRSGLKRVTPNMEGHLEDAEAIRATLAGQQHLVDAMVAIAATQGTWPELWKQSPQAQRDLQRVSCAGRLLTVAALLEIERNVPPRAIIDAQLRFAHSLEHVPNLWSSCLIQMMVDQGAREALWNGLEKRVWDDDALRHFAGAFLSRNGIRRQHWILTADRAFAEQMTSIYRSDPRILLGNLGRATSANWDTLLLKSRMSRGSWWRHNQLWIQRFFDEELAALHCDAQYWSPSRPRQFDPEKLNTNRNQFGLAFDRCAHVGTITSYAVSEHAQSKMAAIACALELYFRATGQYPGKLDQLLPNYLPEMPADPCGGGQFRYARQPDGTYLLYSIGPDLLDNAHEYGWYWWGPRKKR